MTKSPNKLAIPFWQYVTHKLDHSLQGLIRGTPYLYNVATGDVYRKAGNWVLMNDAELESMPYIKKTLADEYQKLKTRHRNFIAAWDRKDKRKAYSLAATRASACQYR